MERQVAGDALGFDPQRARREQRHLRLAEAAVRAGVVDDRLGRRCRRSPTRVQLALAMLELGQHDRRRHADAASALCAGRARLTSHSPPDRRRERARQRRLRPAAAADKRSRPTRADSNATSHHASHLPRTSLTESNFLCSSGQLRARSGSSVAQNAQSTRIMPSSPTIAARSSGGKRAITDRDIVGVCSGSRATAPPAPASALPPPRGTGARPGRRAAGRDRSAPRPSPTRPAPRHAAIRDGRAGCAAGRGPPRLRADAGTAGRRRPSPARPCAPRGGRCAGSARTG